MGICVITGASSGLGREYALAVMRQRPEIDEFWLIARRLDRLEALKAELGGKAVRIMALDLTDSESFREYERALGERGEQQRYRGKLVTGTEVVAPGDGGEQR